MAVIWFTGQPGSGKTTLAKRLLVHTPRNTFHIDGDDLRALNNNQDYSKEGRMKNVQLAQQIAHYLHNQKKNVIVSLVSPYREQREEFKKVIGKRFLEIHTHTSDIRGKEDYFVADYEVPIDNFLDIDTTTASPAESLQEILEFLKK
jgi:adenylylsulfate kinase-like enzyme